MNRYLFLLLICVTSLLMSCRSKYYATHLLNKELMNTNYATLFPETFNIEEYSKNKREFDLYVRIIDGVEIRQEYDNYFNQYSILIERKEDPVFSYLRDYYPSGIIKQKLYLYVRNSSSVEIGIWEYYDEQGKLIKTENKDKAYKVSYKQALDIAHTRFGFLPQDVSIQNIGDSWLIICKKGNHQDQGAMVKQNSTVQKIDKVKYQY